MIDSPLFQGTQTATKDRSRNNCPISSERHGASRRFYAPNEVPVASAIPLTYSSNAPKPTRNTWRRCVVLSVALLLQTGCRVTLPSWLQPGHLYHQQLQATRFDPYADVEAGPEVTGVRPRSYQRPRAQAEKAQWSLDPAGL